MQGIRASHDTLRHHLLARMANPGLSLEEYRVAAGTTTDRAEFKADRRPSGSEMKPVRFGDLSKPSADKGATSRTSP